MACPMVLGVIEVDFVKGKSEPSNQFKLYIPIKN